MGTTVRLDPDVASGVEDIRMNRHVSLSEAVNLLARSGLNRISQSSSPTFVQRTAPLGLTIDVTNIAETLESLDGADHT